MKHLVSISKSIIIYVCYYFILILLGFKILIQKEWLSFGHPFQWRSGHINDGKGDDQISQVFIQFLDCVWQLLRLFPRHFEFNSRYLLILSDHVYSCRFGTFIFNCEYDKVRRLFLHYCVYSFIVELSYLFFYGNLFLFLFSE